MAQEPVPSTVGNAEQDALQGSEDEAGDVNDEQHGPTSGSNANSEDGTDYEEHEKGSFLRGIRGHASLIYYHIQKNVKLRGQNMQADKPLVGCVV
jgi:hypothetical protein